MAEAKEHSNIIYLTNPEPQGRGLDGDRDGNINSFTTDDVVIAVIDSGIYPFHFEFWNDKILAYVDMSEDPPTVTTNPNHMEDRNIGGHGTHCASIAAGGITGVAPGASLVVIQIYGPLNDLGLPSSTASIVDCFDWIFQNRETYGIDLVTVSLGLKHLVDVPGYLAHQASVHNLIQNGIPVIAAIGNVGSDRLPANIIPTYPGAFEYVIGVGNVADPSVPETNDHWHINDDTITGIDCFSPNDNSITGPSVPPFGTDPPIPKPDFVAPGTDIWAASKTGPTHYCHKTGTSMATPFVAGVVALILDKRPDLSEFDPDWDIDGPDGPHSPGGSKVEQFLQIEAVWDMFWPAQPVDDQGNPVQDNVYGWGRVDGWRLSHRWESDDEHSDLDGYPPKENTLPWGGWKTYTYNDEQMSPLDTDTLQFIKPYQGQYKIWVNGQWNVYLTATLRKSNGDLVSEKSGYGTLYFSGSGTSAQTYFIEVKACSNDDVIDMYGEYDLTLQLYKPISGGGCPILSVYDGYAYQIEGLLDIHNPEWMDVTGQHTLATMPAVENHCFYLRLTEHHLTHSYIDQVQLYGRLADGRLVRLPLLSAIHSDEGQVRWALWSSDDRRVDLVGAAHNEGISESIDLIFCAPNREFIEFVFVIEGHNPVGK